MSPFFHREVFLFTSIIFAGCKALCNAGNFVVTDSRLDLKLLYQRWSVGEEKVKYVILPIWLINILSLYAVEFTVYK